MNDKTVIKLVLVIDDKDNTTYTVTRMVSPTELQYIQSVADEGLNCMIDGLKYLPKWKPNKAR